MALSRRSSIVLLLIGFLVIGLTFPQPIISIYESEQSGGMTYLNSDMALETDNCTAQLDLYQIDDADSVKDYYYIEYHFEDLKYGEDAAISPCYIEVEIAVAALGTVDPTLGLLLAYRNPDPGWVTQQGLLGLSAGSVFFQSEEDGLGSAWARWNISGTGGWPLFVHVADEGFTISLGFFVGEMEGISIGVSCSIMWVLIDRFLGRVQYIDQISLPDAEVAHEP
jgi:hypothetical protein